MHFAFVNLSSCAWRSQAFQRSLSITYANANAVESILGVTICWALHLAALLYSNTKLAVNCTSASRASATALQNFMLYSIMWTESHSRRSPVRAAEGR